MRKDKKVKVLGGAIADCVHVAGVFGYLEIARHYGYDSIFLGAAINPYDFIEEIKRNKPDIVCVSYRLSHDALDSVLKKFCDNIIKNDLHKNAVYYFGGTPQCVETAKKYSLFKRFFSGEEPLTFIKETLFREKQLLETGDKLIQKSLIDVNDNRQITDYSDYYPLIRLHFGLSSLDETIRGVSEIADSKEVDVISLAPDQNAQEFFFTPHKMDQSLNGSGGVPVRNEEDLIRIKEAASRGNFPHIKIYSGTNNLLKWAEMSLRLLDVPWGTVPLFWYSELDGRSKRTLVNAITENMGVIKWYSQKNIPVEINDSHQWGLRECSDVISVVDFYLAAYIAKKLGVKKFIGQFMFNNPRLISPQMDLAKMLAKIELVDELVDDDFNYLKQVRAGLSHFSIDADVAKGQLAASTVLSLSVAPNIIHVVSYCEANYAAGPKEIIESCKIVKGALRNFRQGLPDITKDNVVVQRRNYLVTEARKVIDLIKNYFIDLTADPLSDPKVLEFIVKKGVFDAPHLKGCMHNLGSAKTFPYNGGYDCVNDRGEIVKDSDRINKVLEQLNSQKKMFIENGDEDE